MSGRLIIVCGLPGAGKTTHARRLESELGAIRMCPDEWMQDLGVSLWEEAARGKIEALQWRFAQRLLSLGQIVVIEWGTWARSERDELRVGARSLGSKVELHYLTAPVDVLLERIVQRGMEEPPMTREQLESSASCFQAPTAEELALYDPAAESNAEGQTSNQ